MKRLLVVAALILFPTWSLAQETTPVAAPLPAPAVAPAAEPAPAPVPTATEEFERMLNSDPSLQETFGSGKDVYEAIMEMKKAKEDGGTINLIMVMALLAAAFKFLLSVVKFIRRDYWKTDQGKTVLRLIALGLGLGVLVTSKIAMGMHWSEAIILALSGPGAIVVHEVIDLFPGMKGNSNGNGSPA